MERFRPRVAGRPHRWPAVTDEPVLLVLRSLSAPGHGQRFAAFLAFLPLCLTLPASLVLLLAAFALCFAFLATPMTDSLVVAWHATIRWLPSSALHAAQNPGWAGSVPSRERRGPDHQDHADEKGDQPAGFEQPCSPPWLQIPGSRLPTAGRRAAFLCFCAATDTR